MSELVSIVVVAHDNWPDLELAIQSALSQSHRPTEVIVVDNGSQDGTPEGIRRRFGDSVRYIRQANLLDAGGYNTGIRAASGDHVQLLDGDDFLAPDKVEKQLAVFRADPEVDIVYGDFRHFRLRPGVADWDDTDNREYDDLLLAVIENGAGLVIESALFRRRALERVGRWDESIRSADQDYWLRAAWAGCRFRYCPGSLCFYQVRPGQMSADPVSMMRRMEATWAKALGYITDEPYRSAIRARLARLRFYLAVSGGLSRPEALDRLRLAREGISGPAYALGRVLVALAPARRLAGADWLRPLRRRFARPLGLQAR